MTDLALVPDPDEAAYAELGVADPALGRLIHVALSRLIGDSQGDRRSLRNVKYVLAGLGRLAFRRADGVIESAPAPGLRQFGWRDGRTVLSLLSMTPQDLDAKWKAQAADGVHATLPLELVSEFFDPELWPVIAQVVLWGPAECVERVERFARLEAVRRVPSKRSRPDGGTVSAATIDSQLGMFRTFLNVFVELNLRGYPSSLVERWVPLPRPNHAVDLGAVEDPTDRSAPPLLLVRRTLRALDYEVARRRQTARGRKTMKRALRKRLLLALLATTGARIGAIGRLRVCDYDPAHRFPAGEVGPAIRLYPGKTVAATSARWKALPDEVAVWLEELVAYFDLSGPDSLWPSPRKEGASTSQYGLATLITGVPTAVPPVRPLLPRDQDPTMGYSPHTLRHLAEQFAYDVGHDYLSDHPEARAFITPQVLADALLDHAIAGDALGYKDLATSEGRERWARVAGLGLWEYLWGDRGARKAPDVDRIRTASARLEELTAEASPERSAREDRRAA